MRFLRHVFVSLIVVLLISSNSFSTNYYVSSSKGNDSWTGLAPDYVSGNIGPWKTLNKANSVYCNPGDSILLKKGDIWYNEYLTISKSGLAGSPITYTSYGIGEKPILYRASLISSWNGPDSKGIYSTSPGSCAWLFEDDIVLPKASSLENVGIDGYWYYSTGTIYYKPTSGDIRDHTLRRMAGATVYFNNNSSYNIFSDLKFIGSGFYKSSACTSLDNLTISNCDFYQCDSAVWIDQLGTAAGPYSNISIINNNFDYCMTNIYLVNQQPPYYGYPNLYIANNKITHSNTRILGPDAGGYKGDADGISIQNMTNSIIEGNDISGSCRQYAGITHWIDSHYSSENVIIRYNYIHDVDNSGIHIQGSALEGVNRNTSIYGNIIANFDKNPANDITYRGAIRIQTPQTLSKPSLIANNTIYNGDIGITICSLANYYNIYNNIIHSLSSYYIYAQGKVKNIKIDYNDYFNSSTNSAFYYNGLNKNLSDWKISIGNQDRYSLISDPYLLDPGNGNFRLNYRSPCKKAGTYVGLTKDFLGNIWRSTPSIGAIEYYSIAGIISPWTIGGSNYGLPK